MAQLRLDRDTPDLVFMYFAHAFSLDFWHIILAEFVDASLSFVDNQ